MSTIDHSPRTERSVLITEALARLHRHWRFLAAQVVLAVLLALAYLYIATPIHYAYARILVQQRGLMTEREVRTGPDRDFLATQAEIISSPVVVGNALERIHWPLPEVPEADRPTVLLKSLNVSPILGTDVLRIGFRTPWPDQAVQTVDAIIESYRKYLHGMELDTQSDALRVLTESERNLREEFAQLQQDYVRLREESQLLGQGNQAADVERAALVRLGDMLAQARSSRIDLENRLQALHAGQVAEVPDAADQWSPDALLEEEPGNAEQTSSLTNASLVQVAARKPALPRARGHRDQPGVVRDLPREIAATQLELDRALVRVSDLSQRYGAKHPEVRAAQEQAAAWQRFLDDNLREAPRLLKRQLAAVQLTEQRLSELYSEEFAKTKALDLQQLKEQQVVEQIERIKLLHEAALTKLRDWELDEQILAQGRATVLVRVLEGPALDKEVIWPRPFLILGFAAVAGLAVGVGLLLAREVLNGWRPSAIAAS